MSDIFSYDAIVIGGGHNGLTNAAYLAKAGKKVLVLEQRNFVGGAAITEELRPGYQFTTFSYALSLLRPEIIQELDLVRYGFMPLLMRSHFAPMENGDYFLLGPDAGLIVKKLRGTRKPTLMVWSALSMIPHAYANLFGHCLTPFRQTSLAMTPPTPRKWRGCSSI